MFTNDGFLHKDILLLYSILCSLSSMQLYMCLPCQSSPLGIIVGILPHHHHASPHLLKPLIVHGLALLGGVAIAVGVVHSRLPVLWQLQHR